MEKYERPGEKVVSKVPNKAYTDNYDAIFRKKPVPNSWVCPVEDCHFYNYPADSTFCVNCGASKP